MQPWMRVGNRGAPQDGMDLVRVCRGCGEVSKQRLSTWLVSLMLFMYDAASQVGQEAVVRGFDISPSSPPKRITRSCFSHLHHEVYQHVFSRPRQIRKAREKDTQSSVQGVSRLSTTQSQMQCLHRRKALPELCLRQ